MLVKSWIISTALLLCGVLAAAEPLTWSFGANEMPRKQNGAHAVLGEAVTPDGKKALQVWANYDTEELKYPPVITFMAPAATLDGVKAVEISFYCRAEFPGQLDLRITPRNNTATHLSDTVPVRFTTQWKKLSVVLTLNANRTAEPVVQLPRILLGTVKKGQKIEFGPITVRPAAAGEVSK